MNIPLIDLRAQHAALKEEIASSLSEVIERTSFIHGPKVKAFEEAFAGYHGAATCVGLNSGTDALFLAMKAFGVKPGDEVITVPFTFFATAEAIVNAGASIRFVDVDPERYTLDPSKLEEAITPRTVGILPVHIYGTPADMDPILAVARKRGLWVLEDACQAHGAVYKGKRVGSLGDAAAFSFYPSKNLGAYGDAGALLTSDPRLADVVRRLRDHGQTSRYHSELIGYNSRLDAMQAAVLQVKLPRLDGWNAKRRQVAAWYAEALKGVKDISPPKSFPDCEQVYHLYVIRTPKREELAAHLERNGVATASHYTIPLHRQPPFQNDYPLPYPVSESLCKSVLSLPMFPEITREQVDYVGEKIKSFFS